MTALQLSAQLRAKSRSVVEAVTPAFDAAQRNEWGAFLRFDAEYKTRVLERAASVQSRLDAGELSGSPLAGVPIVIKDNISVAGEECSACSRMLAGYKPVFSATVIERLEKAGLVIVGRANMDEFAVGTTGESSVHGGVTNPHNSAHVAGGSSSGSAVAVASGAVPLALGSDSGGSIRLPAAYCGAVAIKPSYGGVSRNGLFALASSMEQVGTIAANVDDALALLEIISGADNRDGTCVAQEPLAFADRKQDLKGVKLAVIAEVSDDIRDALKSAGAELAEIALPMREVLLPTYFIIACAEMASNFARYDGLKYGQRSPQAQALGEIYRLSRAEGFGRAVKTRLMFGTLITTSDYYDSYFRQALKVRGLIKREYDKLLSEYDAIVTPTAAAVAPKLGETPGGKVNECDIFTVFANLGGYPAVTLPCGVGEGGLPLGLQLVGGAFKDAQLGAIARVCEPIVRVTGGGA